MSVMACIMQKPTTHLPSPTASNIIAAVKCSASHGAKKKKKQRRKRYKDTSLSKWVRLNLECREFHSRVRTHQTNDNIKLQAEQLENLHDTLRPSRDTRILRYSNTKTEYSGGSGEGVALILNVSTTSTLAGSLSMTC